MSLKPFLRHWCVSSVQCSLCHMAPKSNPRFHSTVHRIYVTNTQNGQKYDQDRAKKLHFGLIFSISFQHKVDFVTFSWLLSNCLVIIAIYLRIKSFIWNVLWKGVNSDLLIRKRWINLSKKINFLEIFTACCLIMKSK